MLTREDVMVKAREERVKFLRLQFTDIFGALKNIAVTSEDLDQAMNGKVTFDSCVIDGVTGNRERDIILRPDPSSFLVLPWRPREEAVARFICDIENTDGTPYQGCSRNILQQVLAEANRMGLDIWAGAEVEFYLFYTDDNGNPTTCTHDLAENCDLTPVDLGENARRDMVLTMEEMGIDVGSSHHAKGPGQHCITLKTDSVLAIADQLVTFKFIVRTIAQRHGLHASFMPKPLNGKPGSALHFHLLLHNNGSLFAGKEGTGQLDDRNTGHFIAGILAHARANAAITNPLVNSYKRLIPGDPAAPACVAWSKNSRDALLRVVPYHNGGNRLEIRNPDPACNPYLALAVILKAGLEGIKQQLAPPPPLDQDIENPGYASPPAGDHNHQQPEKVRLTHLPRTLEEALRELAADQLARATLGEYIYRKYIRSKGEEWERFQAFVHPWELQQYLAKF